MWQFPLESCIQPKDPAPGWTGHDLRAALAKMRALQGPLRSGSYMRNPRTSAHEDDTHKNNEGLSKKAGKPFLPVAYSFRLLLRDGRSWRLSPGEKGHQAAYSVPSMAIPDQTPPSLSPAPISAFSMAAVGLSESADRWIDGAKRWISMLS